MRTLAAATLLAALAANAAAAPPETFLPPAPSPASAPTQSPTPPPAKPVASAPAPAQGPSAADAIRELQTAYRGTSICERVQIEVHYPAPAPATGTRIARSTIAVQLAIDPPASAAPDGQTQDAHTMLALELGALRITAARSQLTAIHSRDPSTFFQAPIADQLTSKVLADVLPPILIPELDLRSARPDAPLSAFWPYATDISWQSVEMDPKHPTKRTIHATCAGGGGGSITLIAQNNRLRSLTIDLPAKRTTLALTFSPFGPCDLSKAIIETTRRQRVDAMDELRPRSGTLRVGVRLPHMPITQGINGQGWDMGALLQPTEQATLAGIKPAEHVVLLFLRQNPLTPPSDGKDQRFNPEALARILRTMREDAFKARIPAPSSTSDSQLDKDPAAAIARFGYAPVLIMGSPNPDDLLKKLRDANATWPEVLWTTEAKATIDLFAPTADAAAIILDSEFVLRGVVPIEPSQTAEQVGDQVAALLFELGAGEK
jgi:hypothetical protein